MEEKNQCSHIFERKSSLCMNNFNAGTQFIQYQFYQVDTQKFN